jgi:pimeloyl-ACP methyl ester carboxylesterase
MLSTDQTSPATGGTLPTSQRADALLVVTCRANPESKNPEDCFPLGAGDYQVAWATPDEAAPHTPLRFSYGPWKLVSHRKPPADAVGVLPEGDVLVVVHGFDETAPEGVQTGQKVAQGLKRTGGITVAAGAQPPMSQSGALRLARTLQNRLPAEPLYRSLVAFTWPSAHRIFPGYLLDKEEVARFAAFSLANLLADLRAAQPDRRILLVAHSMGCFLTIKALNILSVLRSAQAASRKSAIIVDQMVFYAADINADALQSDPAPNRPSSGLPSETVIARKRNSYGYQALDRVGRLTIYYSFHDNVLIWSPFANFFSEESGGDAGRARLGWCGPLDIATTHQNVVAVDCSACIYDHAAYFVRHEVLEHTARTLAEPAPTTEQPAYEDAPLQTTAEGGQSRAHRLWTWYTPAEIAREGWERFFFDKPRWARRVGFILGVLLFLAFSAAVIYGLAEVVF